MKEFFQILIIIGAIITGLYFFLLLIGRATVYGDQTQQKKMEYCISQNQHYSDCFNAIYEGAKYPSP